MTDTPTLMLTGAPPVERRRPALTGRPVHERIALAGLRLLAMAPLVAMAPEIAAAAEGRPKGVANVVTSSNDVLGTGALLLFVLMLTTSPLTTVTGWRWHRILRRDFGRAMFAVAATDFAIAATMTGSRFPGGLLSRVAGHAFLLSGTLATFLVVPLMATSNRAAQRWLGRHWPALHRLVYVAWITIAAHLAFLFAFRSFLVDFLIVSAPLALLRVTSIERGFVHSRRAGSHPLLRAAAGLALLGVFLFGLVPFLVEFAHVGVGAFTGRPPQ